MNPQSTSSLENAIAGRYNFGIRAIFGEAWKKTHGIKATYWKALLCLLVITGISMIIANLIGNLLEGPISHSEASFYPAHDILGLIVSIFLTIPLTAGIWMIMIRHISGMPVTYQLVFKYFRYWKTLWAYPVVLVALQWLGVLFAGMPILALVIALLSLFFVVTYFMFIPLVVEKNLSTLAAFETSRKTIFHHWFKMLWFVILIALIGMLSLLTLGIAFIWTLPWVNNANAILYRNMFGVQQTS